MAKKKFRNTKARRREIAEFSTLWKKTKNRVYYRKRTKGIDYSNYLPIKTKRELSNLSTKDIKRINNQLGKIVSSDSNFFTQQSIINENIPQSAIKRVEYLDKQLGKINDKTNERDADRPIVIGRNRVSNDTVLSQRLMGKPNLALTVPIKPYVVTEETSLQAIESAIRVRENRLNPEWHEERKDIMKMNYMNSLIDLYNDEADEVIEKLKDLPSSDFYDLYQQFEAIDFVYVPSGDNQPTEDEYESLSLLSQILDDFSNGKINTDGKVFN